MKQYPKRPYNRRRDQANQAPKQHTVDAVRCAKSPTGKHHWITSYRLADGTVGTMTYPACLDCLEIGEREVAT